MLFFVQLLTLLNIFKYSFCYYNIFIYDKDLNSNLFPHYVQVIVNSTKELNVILNNDTNPVYNKLVSVAKYNGDQEIDLIEDFLHVEIMWMENIGQRNIPVFNRNPKLLSINLSKNDIQKVNKTSFGDVDIKFLYLSNNEISEIEDGSFGVNVCFLQLGCNRLTKFSSKWFQDGSNISVLNLGGNNIESIKREDFQKLTKLRDLNLMHNKLKRIESGAFLNIKYFQFLHLQHNELTELNDILDETVNLERLNIQYNNLTYLREEFMRKIKVRIILNMEGNPWDCKCLEKILKWNFGTTKLEHNNNLWQKEDIKPYCIESVPYCDPNIINKEQLIKTYSELLEIPETKKEFCVDYFEIRYQLCNSCSTCYYL